MALVRRNEELESQLRSARVSSAQSAIGFTTPVRSAEPTPVRETHIHELQQGGAVTSGSSGPADSYVLLSERAGGDASQVSRPTSPDGIGATAMAQDSETIAPGPPPGLNAEGEATLRAVPRDDNRQLRDAREGRNRSVKRGRKSNHDWSTGGARASGG